MCQDEDELPLGVNVCACTRVLMTDWCPTQSVLLPHAQYFRDRLSTRPRIKRVVKMNEKINTFFFLIWHTKQKQKMPQHVRVRTCGTWWGLVRSLNIPQRCHSPALGSCWSEGWEGRHAGPRWSFPSLTSVPILPVSAQKHTSTVNLYPCFSKRVPGTPAYLYPSNLGRGCLL